LSADPGKIRLLEGTTYLDPFAAYTWLREHSPVHWDEEGEVWGLFRHAEVMFASKHPALFSSQRNGSRPDSPALPSMINLDDPVHNLRRRLVYRGFTPRAVLEHEPFVRGLVTELIDAVAALGRCDFVADLAGPLPMLVIGELLGVRREDRMRLQRWSDAMIEATRSDAPPDVAERAARVFAEYSDYHRDVAAQRRERPQQDLVSVLVQAQIDGRGLKEDEILHESLLLLVGGNETTRNVLSGGMEALIRNPDQRVRLLRDPSRIPLAVEELLRWVSPISNMNRTATQDLEIRGRSVRKGDKVLLMYASANRDEQVFERPERLDVERDPNPHVAFGGYGPHFCLGASLARLELRVLFEELLRRLPDMELAEPGPLEVTPSNFIRGLRRMPVEFTPTTPLLSG
jgi:cytochrome P450 family 142 subfamily A polypeptide 1